MSSTLPSSETTSATLVANLARLGALMHKNSDLSLIWSELSRVLAQQFGHSLFTILTYSSTLGVTRIYSTRPDLHPLGTRYPGGSSLDAGPPERAAWIQRVLVESETWRGSTKEDLKAVFDDWSLLWSVGLGSVLNIPVRLEDKTIGSLNILDKEHAYDAADLDIGILIASMVAFHVQKAGQTLALASVV
ncbi:hypothetical protein LTR10_017380 [Elasticomyces elasticus]|uniref:GAF domain-containing protein n=1 Tax=Exophiala sideris TaxID=1016849 RepID=A0ABR0JAP2_9EURO|nr:hypothetical protein LTR10_017380 [Elasticomyces elasticus]KAK5027864.1 hypothetical protein LTS07_006739 [Exophiala sideris]KAK5037546.1 hypothetical protein LTR13_004704 [Exophiala sideris]KAK5059207.1 hypothetical protein LTR69_006497 [Exophiala sideris]KAK5183042.1 hypothetical protein LTR44_004753 [Eurotiomycetes sp. CCFEE 6388]